MASRVVVKGKAKDQAKRKTLTNGGESTQLSESTAYSGEH